jgi:hypothetical protein
MPADSQAIKMTSPCAYAGSGVIPPLIPKPEDHPKTDGAIRDEHWEGFPLKRKTRLL